MAYRANVTTYGTVIFTTVKSSEVQVMLLQKFQKVLKKYIHFAV